MNNASIVILAWTMGALVALALYLVWRRLRYTSQRHVSISPNDSRRIVRKALRALNCTPVWSKENEDSLADYTYQGSSFRIRLVKNSPFMKLSCLSFYSVHAEQMELMRNICNQCNLNTDNCRLTYMVNKADGTAHMHILSSLLLTNIMPLVLFKRIMDDIFLWKNVFIRRFEEVVKDTEAVGNADIEKAGMELSRNIYLVREQEMLHQSAGPEWREEPNSRLTLKYLLSTAMGLSHFLPIRMTVIYDEHESHKIETDEIRNFALSTMLIDEGRFTHHAATFFLSYFDRILPDKERHLIVHLSAELGDEQSLYSRITITQIPLSAQRINPVGTDNNKTIALSMLAAYDLRPSQSRIDEFRYLWKEAMAKLQREGFDALTEDERLIIACINPQVGYHLYRGKMLFTRKCFIEAIPFLEYVYHTLHRYLPGPQLEVHQYFFEVSYMLGFCYNALHQYDRAYYYLELLLPLHNIIYTEEYINCMVNGGDLRAYGVIEGILQELGNLPNKEKINGHFDLFESFLKRRKAYLLVEQENYDEAEKLLRSMIDEPENSDFAIQELAYIRKRKGEKQ